MLLRIVDRFVPTTVTDYALDVAYGLRHPALLRSGATGAEARRPLPGDDLVAEPAWVATRAITVDAPPNRVWPWLAQMGWSRGGWYWWADTVREDRASATRILRKFQTLEVGDVLLDGPECNRTKGAWAVRAVDPERSLVLSSARDPITGMELDLRLGAKRFIDCSWTFVLEPIEPRATRLLVRTRVDFAPRWATPLVHLLGAGDTVMQRTMLQGIKERAERAHAPRATKASRAA
jgi:hypothetical protein